MSTHWIKRYLIAGITCIAGGQVFAQQAPSLAELAAKAVAKSYELSNMRLAIQSEQETRKSISEVYLPHLEAGAKYAYLNSNLLADIPSTTLPILNIPVFEGDSEFSTRGNLWTADLTASVVLFSGTKAPKLGKALDHKIEAQERLIEKQRQEIIDKVSTAYDQLILLRQVQLLLTESEKRLQIEKKTAEKAFGYGLITSYELNKVDVAQATLTAKLQEYTGKHRLLLQQLHQLTGVSIEELELIDRELRPFPIDGSATGIGNRPEIAALNAAIEASKYRVAAEKTHWIPKVQALARVGYYGLTDTRMTTPYQNPVTGREIDFRLNRLQAFPSYTVGIGMKWDIFDGFKGRREVNKARIEVQKAENNRAHAEEMLTLNLEKARTEYQLTLKQVAAGETRWNIAQKALALAQKEYKTGLIKLAERISAETDHQQAALDYYQAVFNQRRAAYQLLMATGDLTLEHIN